jgi:hypothetical protein
MAADPISLQSERIVVPKASMKIHLKPNIKAKVKIFL